jgi:uncharacterized repeat protein (TIGR01451 family)
MTVVADPNPVVETSGSNGIQSSQATLNIVKSDSVGGSSLPPPTGTLGSDNCFQPMVYTITVTNSGSTTVNPVIVTDDFSTNIDFADDTYTSVAAGGATGNTQGTGPGIGGYNDINDSLDLPPGSSVVYTVTADLSDDVGVDSAFSNTATLTPPSGITLTPSSNLTATDNDVAACAE